MAYIDATDLGIYLQRDFSDDPLADFACEAAVDIIRTYTNQLLDAEEADEIKVDGTGTDALLLPEHPVVAVVSVSIGDDDPLVEDDDYVVHPYTGIVFRLNGFSWPRGRQNISVTYTHGYEEDEVPQTIRLVALQVAARIYAAGGTSDPDNTAIGHLLPIERSVLDRWTLKGAKR